MPSLDNRRQYRYARSRRSGLSLSSAHIFSTCCSSPSLPSGILRKIFTVATKTCSCTCGGGVEPWHGLQFWAGVWLLLGFRPFLTDVFSTSEFFFLMCVEFFVGKISLFYQTCAKWKMLTFFITAAATTTNGCNSWGGAKGGTIPRARVLS